jgi:hypothetical protein
MPAASTATVQTTPAGSAELGVSVKLVAGEAESVNARGEPTGHSSANELVLALTLSLKLTVIVALVATPVAPLAGVVLVTVGAASVLKLNT